MKRIWLRWMIVLMLLSFTLFYAENAPFGNERALKKDLRLFPDRIDQWHQVFSEESDQMTALNDTGAYVSKRFRNEGGEEVYLYIGYWGKFDKGINVFEGETITPGKNWGVTYRSVKQVNLKGLSLKFNETSFKKGQENVLVSYWYVLGGKGVVNKETGRIKHAIDAMLNRRTNVALIKISSRYLSPADLNWHQDLHSSFIRELTPILPEFLPYEL